MIKWAMSPEKRSHTWWKKPYPDIIMAAAVEAAKLKSEAGEPEFLTRDVQAVLRSHGYSPNDVNSRDLGKLLEDTFGRWAKGWHSTPVPVAKPPEPNMPGWLEPDLGLRSTSIVQGGYRPGGVKNGGIGHKTPGRR